LNRFSKRLSTWVSVWVLVVLCLATALIPTLPTGVSGVFAQSTCVFPTVGVSDNFNRVDGTSLLGAWFGGTSNYAVASNQLGVTGTGESIMAWNQLLGNNQEASVKIANVGASTTAIRLALKVKEGSFSNPHILVSYLPSQGRIQVLTYDTTLGYIERGSYTVTLQTGDVLGARALSTGDVMAYRNGVEVIRLSAANWPNTAEGGFSGLWLSSAAGAVLDDYSAGNVDCTNLTPTPIRTPGTCPFPLGGISDNFNRADGTSLEGSWFGGTSNYGVASNQLSVTATGEAIMAWNQLLGNNQEASVKIVNIGASTTAIRLALKVKEGRFSNPHMLVSYLPNPGRIQVLSYDTTLGYIERGSYTVTLQAGDVLGARALNTGDVMAYRNDIEVLRINAFNWPNTTEGGFSGLWLSSAVGAVLDDYRAGNVNCSPAPTSTPPASGTMTETIFLPMIQK
jgi:hypothetical protein